MKNLTLDTYHKKIRLRFLNQKECRKFINSKFDEKLIPYYSIDNWYYKVPNNYWGIKLGKILRIKGQTIIFDCYERLSIREYNLEKLLHNEK